MCVFGRAAIVRRAAICRRHHKCSARHQFKQARTLPTTHPALNHTLIPPSPFTNTKRQFLVDREGRVVGRFAPTTTPEQIGKEVAKLL